MVPTDYRQNKRFCLIYPLVLKVEGGYLSPERAKKIGDKGGATKFGVAYNMHAMRLKQYGINQPADMINLTKEQALDFYYKYFWVPSQADEIPHTPLAFLYWDMAVNSGVEAADNQLAKLAKVPGWGKWHFYEGDGKNLNLFWCITFYFAALRLFFYTDIRQWSTFGKGWTRRVATLQMEMSKVTVGGL